MYLTVRKLKCIQALFFPLSLIEWEWKTECVYLKGLLLLLFSTTLDESWNLIWQWIVVKSLPLFWAKIGYTWKPAFPCFELSLLSLKVSTFLWLSEQKLESQKLPFFSLAPLSLQHLESFYLHLGVHCQLGDLCFFGHKWWSSNLPIFLSR